MLVGPSVNHNQQEGTKSVTEATRNRVDDQKTEGQHLLRREKTFLNCRPELYMLQLLSGSFGKMCLFKNLLCQNCFSFPKQPVTSLFLDHNDQLHNVKERGRVAVVMDERIYSPHPPLDESFLTLVLSPGAFQALKLLFE